MDEVVQLRLRVFPKARRGELTLQDYVASNASDKGWWSHFDKYIVSLLKAYFGDAATEENGYGFHHLPKITGNHSHFPTMLRAYDGGLRLMVVPAVSNKVPGPFGPS